MNQASLSPKVLVAPLDWGLGHATRCIPVIRQLLQQDCRVVLAASGGSKVLLQQEFPSLPMLQLPAYDIEYAAAGWGLAAKIVAQIPKLLSVIKEEHAWLQNVVKEQEIDAVISDNRYGLYHQAIPTAFITHQLCIQTPFGIGQALVQEKNYEFINRFTECWVPDAAGEQNLAGNLSHPTQTPSVPLFYTGPLSRFLPTENNGTEKHLLILLSGPEPQRTMLEEKLVAELEAYPNPFVLVRGLPGKAGPLSLPGSGTVYNHLPAAALQPLLADASMVISRCGYSTVMDLAVLQKKSILVPTPGQTEQEYLAGYLMQKNAAFCVAQKKFRLKNVLALAADFSYHLPPPPTNELAEVVKNFLKKVKMAEAGIG